MELKPAWYILHCYSGYESKVLHDLQMRVADKGMMNHIIQILTPAQQGIEVEDEEGRKTSLDMRPGLMLINMVMEDNVWNLVTHTPGITGFAGIGAQPTAFPNIVALAEILKRL